MVRGRERERGPVVVPTIHLLVVCLLPFLFSSRFVPVLALLSWVRHSGMAGVLESKFNILPAKVNLNGVDVRRVQPTHRHRASDDVTVLDGNQCDHPPSLFSLSCPRSLAYNLDTSNRAKL